nr:integrase, catalytic region, zinc finger, CCHC-type, peptidase aspartic, catalytic [Tanacetum cinerariifolium]
MRVGNLNLLKNQLKGRFRKQQAKCLKPLDTYGNPQDGLSRQFCDSDLEVAFRQHTCFIRNLEGVDLLIGKGKGCKKVTANGFDRDTVSSPESAPTFAELFEINDLKAQIQEKDTVILKLREKLNSLSGDVKSSRVQSKEQCDDLINKVNLKSVGVSDLNASLQEKVLVITALKEQLNKPKGKAILTEAVSLNPIDPALLQVDVASLVLKLRKNRTAHTNYIRHT